MKTQHQIKCPNCGKQNTWHVENSFKPFCSSRCKLIDLGEWANESRKIAGDTVDLNALDNDIEYFLTNKNTDSD